MESLKSYLTKEGWRNDLQATVAHLDIIRRELTDIITDERGSLGSSGNYGDRYEQSKWAYQHYSSLRNWQALGAITTGGGGVLGMVGGSGIIVLAGLTSAAILAYLAYNNHKEALAYHRDMEGYKESLKEDTNEVSVSIAYILGELQNGITKIISYKRRLGKRLTDN